MSHKHRHDGGDPYVLNREAVQRANAYLLKRVALCACLNMIVLSATSPFLTGFSGSSHLYMICAGLTGALALFCHLFMRENPRFVLPIFYGLLLGLCAYGTALSSVYYPDIHGVTIVAIYSLVPMLVLDDSLRVNVFFGSCLLISCLLGFARKPLAIAVDDCVTSCAFFLFGAMIGNHLRAARLRAIDQQRQLELQRDMDALTGLPNRRLLFETLDALDGEEQSAPVAGMIMIDIDDFKGYNDRFGHQAGDECLRRLGERFLAFSAETGVILYRYGGEEFLGLWRSGTPLELGELAWRLVHVAKVCMPANLGITISVGYAYRDRQTPVPTDRLIHMADSALYEAKRQGRNRAVFYSG